MKRSLWQSLLVLSLIVSTYGFAPMRQISVVASAKVVPAQVSHLALPISGLVKEVRVKEGDVVKAGQMLVLLNTPDLEFSVAGAEAAVRAAESRVIISRYKKKTFNWDTFKFVYRGNPPEFRQRADAQLKSAQAALDIAKIALAQGTLAAPFDGTIAAISVSQGELAQAGQPVITLATLNHLRIETTDLSERDIPNVKIGQNASVHVDALNKDFSGKVTAISSMADNVGGDVVYKVTVELDDHPAGLLWGMSAEVTITK